jgi:hypothetical protein
VRSGPRLVLACLIIATVSIGVVPALAVADRQHATRNTQHPTVSEGQPSPGQTRAGTWRLTARRDFAAGTLDGLTLVGDPDAALVLPAGRVHGDFTSAPLPAGFRFMAVGVHWQGDLPPGFDIHLWLRVSDDDTAWSDWAEVPPADAQREPPADQWSELTFATGRWLQVRVELTATPPLPPRQQEGMPRLDELTVVYIDATAGPTAAQARTRADAETPAGIPVVISRTGWGADESYRFSNGQEIWPPEYLRPQVFIVHHTVTDNEPPDPAAQVRAIYYYHAVTRGWGDIGYNFLIDYQGRIYEGRYGGERDGQTVVGGHARQYNYGSIGVALLGTYQEVAPAAAMDSALVDLLAWQAGRFGIDPLGTSFFVDGLYPNIMGHRDVLNTACPGDHVYAGLPAIRQRVADQMQQGMTCRDLVVNGGFEADGGWELSRAYRTSFDKHTGQWSLFVGLLDREADERVWAQVFQALVVPQDFDQASLSFWVYPVSADPSGDQQVAAIRNDSGQPIVEAMVHDPASNSRTWELHQMDVTAALREQQGRTVYLWFAVYNDGDGQGKTYMRVDDVVLTICYGVSGTPTATPGATTSPTSTPTPTATATPSATPRASFTPTPTATPTLTATPSPTSTPCDGGACPSPTPTSTPTVTPTPSMTPTPTATPEPCAELVVNPGFESSAGWVIGDTAYRARYSSEQVHSGAAAMLLGITDPQDDRYSFSSVWQDVTIPSAAASAVFTLWYYPISRDPADRQIVEVRVVSDGSQNRLMGTGSASNSQRWEYASFDLAEHYVGRDVRLYFTVVNQGTDGVTAMFLDDVSLRVCRQMIGAYRIYLPLIRKDKVELPSQAGIK